jgi:hypothetical protein
MSKKQLSASSWFLVWLLSGQSLLMPSFYFIKWPAVVYDFTLWFRKSLIQRTEVSSCVAGVIFTRAGQISTEHLKTYIQHFFETCRLPRLHKFRRCYRNRHTFFGPSETIGVYISKSFFFLSENCDHRKRYRKRSNRWMFWSRFFLFPSPFPSSLRGKMKRFRAQIESKDAAHPPPTTPGQYPVLNGPWDCQRVTFCLPHILLSPPYPVYTNLGGAIETGTLFFGPLETIGVYI